MEKHLLLPLFCLGTLIKNQLPWTTVRVQWLSVLIIHKVLRSASSTQKEGNDPRTCWFVSGSWLLFGWSPLCQFRVSISFGNHKHEFSSFVLSQILSAVLTWDFLTVPSVREHEAGILMAVLLNMQNYLKHGRLTSLLIHRHKTTCHISGFLALGVWLGSVYITPLSLTLWLFQKQRHHRTETHLLTGREWSVLCLEEFLQCLDWQGPSAC